MVRVFLVSLLCLAVSGCLITTPRTQMIVSRSNASDLMRARRVCAAVAARNGLALIPDDLRGFPRSSIPFMLDEYGKPIRTYRTLLSGRLDYTGPTMLVADSPRTPNCTVITIGEWSDTKERRKLADDAAFALEREFGAKRVERRDDRWTEF
jgi:hypothetical protein